MPDHSYSFSVWSLQLIPWIISPTTSLADHSSSFPDLISPTPSLADLSSSYPG
jgi:hypothetical protein